MRDDDPFGNAPDLDELVYTKAELRAMRRQEELEHERQLAAIRTQSHALIWTGTAEELTETIRRWYESGYLRAENLQDALQKAAIHFVKPDGTAVIKLPAPAQETSEIFSASPTYQKLTFRGKDYELTGHKYAPVILKVLHEALKRGEPGLTINQVRKKANLPHNGSMYDWFRGTGLWKTLVVTVGRDLYRLDIP